MKGISCLVSLLLLLIIQKSWQVPLQAGENSSLQTADRMVDEEKDLSDMKRHSEGTFSNDYSNYMEERRAQDFVQWLMNSKRSGTASKRHADGTYTSDVSSYLQDQAAKDFVTWLKSGRTRREFAEDTGKVRGDSRRHVDAGEVGGDSRRHVDAGEVGGDRRRHVDGSFTSDVTKVLDSMAAKEYLLWVMTSNPSGTSNKRQAHL